MSTLNTIALCVGWGELILLALCVTTFITVRLSEALASFLDSREAVAGPAQRPATRLHPVPPSPEVEEQLYDQTMDDPDIQAWDRQVEAS